MTRNVQGLNKICTTKKPFFIITIDTEGDNIWERPSKISTKNAEFLPPFQDLCEKYSLKVTYLTNYEMANSPFFYEFASDALLREKVEIGMHLHAWNTPPITHITSNDLFFQPYLIEYPMRIMSEKVKKMTSTLEDLFGVKMISHRAGRWSFNETYAQILIDNGYKVDSSVTPYISWKNKKGDPSQYGGTDFSDFPCTPYFVNIGNIKQPGISSLLEVPMTIIKKEINLKSVAKSIYNLISQKRNREFKIKRNTYWLRPNGENLEEMKFIVNRNSYEEINYVQLMLHSSELMPGGSPYFRSKSDIKKLYEHLECLFNHVKDTHRGVTLKEYADFFQKNYHL